MILVGIDSEAPRSYWSLLFDIAASFDSFQAHLGDVARATRQVNKYDVQLGGHFTWWFRRPVGLAFDARAGYEVARESGVVRIERCETLPSTDTNVTGQASDPNALFLSGPQPPLQHLGYLRLALDYQLIGEPKRAKFVPGIETRIGVEGLGGRKSVDVRLVVYATPAVGAAAARAGVGVDLSYAIDGTPDGRLPAGSWTVLPFAFVGATTTLLPRTTP